MMERAAKYVMNGKRQTRNVEAMILGLKVAAEHMKFGLATKGFIIESLKGDAVVLDLSDSQLDPSSMSGRAMVKLGYTLNDDGFWEWRLTE